MNTDFLESLERVESAADELETDNARTKLNPTFLKRAVATISSLVQIKPKPKTGYEEQIILTQTRNKEPVILEGIVDHKKNFTKQLPKQA